jgi:hypothetical protein
MPTEPQRKTPMPKLRPWKTRPPEHKDYVFIYLTAIVWCVTYFIFYPSENSLFAGHSFVAVWLLPVVVGAFMGIYGLLMGDNLLTERLGVTLTMIGPAVYGLLQAGITISDIILQPEGVDTTSRIALIVLALWIFLFLNKRRRQLKHKVVEARAVPLSSEKTNK